MSPNAVGDLAEKLLAAGQGGNFKIPKKSAAGSSSSSTGAQARGRSREKKVCLKYKYTTMYTQYIRYNPYSTTALRWERPTGPPRNRQRSSGRWPRRTGRRGRTPRRPRRPPPTRGTAPGRGKTHPPRRGTIRGRRDRIPRSSCARKGFCSCPKGLLLVFVPERAFKVLVPERALNGLLKYRKEGDLTSTKCSGKLRRYAI